MIRFPERFHASETPGANQIGVEPNYLERAPHERPPAQPIPKDSRFDFAALAAALR